MVSTPYTLSIWVIIWCSTYRDDNTFIDRWFFTLRKTNKQKVLDNGGFLRCAYFEVKAKFRSLHLDFSEDNFTFFPGPRATHMRTMKKICKWVSLSTIWAVHSHNPTDSIHLMIKIPAIRITVPLGHVCWPPGNMLVGEKKVIDFHTEFGS